MNSERLYILAINNSVCGLIWFGLSVFMSNKFPELTFPLFLLFPFVLLGLIGGLALSPRVGISGEARTTGQLLSFIWGAFMTLPAVMFLIFTCCFLIASILIIGSYGLFYIGWGCVLLLQILSWVVLIGSFLAAVTICTIIGAYGGIIGGAIGFLVGLYIGSLLYAPVGNLIALLANSAYGQNQEYSYYLWQWGIMNEYNKLYNYIPGADFLTLWYNQIMGNLSWLNHLKIMQWSTVFLAGGLVTCTTAWMVRFLRSRVMAHHSLRGLVPRGMAPVDNEQNLIPESMVAPIFTYLAIFWVLMAYVL